MLPLCSQIGREELAAFCALFVVQGYLRQDACQAIPGLWRVCSPSLWVTESQVYWSRHVLRWYPGALPSLFGSGFRCWCSGHRIGVALLGNVVKGFRKRACAEHFCQRARVLGLDGLQITRAAGARGAPDPTASKPTQQLLQSVLC